MITSSIVIRACTEDDLRPLEWGGLFTHHREIVERTYRAQLAGDQLMLVAEVNGAPHAQAWIDLRRGISRRAGIVWAMRVHPSLQGRGIGTRMMLAAEHRIVEHGFIASELAVEHVNARARRFYERLGYARVRMVHQSYQYTTPDGHFREHHLELIEMRKELRDR